MVGIDTNVLVRFVTKDDEKQWKQADAYLKSNCTEENPGWIACIVACEVVWVLSSGYNYGKKEILALLNQLLLVTALQFENREAVRRAVTNYEHGSADFSDYLIAALNTNNGCERTITFDKKAAKSPDFELLR